MAKTKTVLPVFTIGEFVEKYPFLYYDVPEYVKNVALQVKKKCNSIYY